MTYLTCLNCTYAPHQGICLSTLDEGGVLPLHIAWSGLRTYSLDRAGQRIVLPDRPGGGAARRLTSLLDGGLLVSQWPVARTQPAHPRGAGSGLPRSGRRNVRSRVNLSALHRWLLADVLTIGTPYPLVITGGYAVQAHGLVDRLSRHPGGQLLRRLRLHAACGRGTPPRAAFLSRPLPTPGPRQT